MKKLFGWIYAAGTIVLIVPSILADDVRTIEGQVFVRTQGAETFKLSLVDVALLNETAIAEYVEKRSKAADPIYEALQPIVKVAETREKETEKAVRLTRYGTEGFEKALQDYKDAIHEHSKVLGMSNYLHSALYYFSDLPTPLQTTKTDADGKFTFKVPKGTYVIAATSSRAIGKGTESYCWLVKVVADADKKVMLANDNLSTSNSPDSMIYASVGFPEIYSLTEMQEIIEKRKAVLRAEISREREKELAEYRQNPSAAQKKAILLYPEVGVAGSRLNSEFVSRMKRYRAQKTEFFGEADWPIRLAKECDEDLVAQQSKR